MSNAPTPGAITNFWTTGAAGTTCSSVGGAAASITYEIITGQCYDATIIVNVRGSSHTKDNGTYLNLWAMSSASGVRSQTKLMSYYQNSTSSATFGVAWKIPPGNYQIEMVNASTLAHTSLDIYGSYTLTT